MVLECGDDIVTILIIQAQVGITRYGDGDRWPDIQ